MSDPLKPFAINLRALRRAQGWTQDHVGELAGGMTQGYLSRLENGRVDPSWRTIDRLAKVFDVDPADLVRGRAEPDAPDPS